MPQIAKRRMFKTRAECPGISTDCGILSNKCAIIGRTVTLERSSDSEVNITLDSAVVGQLDAAVGKQVALAIERGQLFTAVIINAYPIYNDRFKVTGAQIDLKVGYVLEKGQPAIKAPTAWRAVESPAESSRSPKSFFTTVAGVTFDGRQRIVARCSVGERLMLVREPENRFDKGAIKVVRANGEQLGFIPAHVSRGDHSSGLAFQMDRGYMYRCRISDLTGGMGKTLGVNIEITEGDDFAGALSTEQAPTQLCVTPVGNSLAWLWVVAAAVLALVIALIAHRSF